MDPDEQPRHVEGGSELSPLWEVWSDGSADGLRCRLVKYVKRKFPSVAHEREFAHDVIVEAFDSAVEAMSRGGSIRNFPAWFYSTVRLIAAKRLRQAELLVERGSDIGAALHPNPSDPSRLAERQRQDERDEALLGRALAHAVELLPQVGTGQVRAVMEIFLEAVREGLPDYPPSTIAEALGIPVASARTLLHRGLTRLRQEAERKGIALPTDLDPETHEPYGTLD